jgi:hypothetical protein
MPVRLIPQDFTLEKSLEEIVYTMAKLTAHPLARPFIDIAQVKFERNKTLILAEIDLRVQRITAQANEEYADDRLNEQVDQFDARISVLPAQTQTGLRMLFFRGKPPSYIKRPILGRQLELMRTWLTILQEATTPEGLRELAKDLSEQIQAADGAAMAKEQANQAARQFRLIGEKKQFIDGLNIWRQELHAELDKISSQTPHLPRDFASTFFRSGYTPTNALSLDEEILQISLQLEEARGTALELEERLKELMDEKARRDTEDEERKRDLVEIEDLERKLVSLRARLKR